MYHTRSFNPINEDAFLGRRSPIGRAIRIRMRQRMLRKVMTLKKKRALQVKRRYIKKKWITTCCKKAIQSA